MAGITILIPIETSQTAHWYKLLYFECLNSRLSKLNENDLLAFVFLSLGSLQTDGKGQIVVFIFVPPFLHVFSRYKMSGELPLLSLRISDVKLRSVLELVDSIPLPESRPAPRGQTSTPKVRTPGRFQDEQSNMISKLP